MRGLVAVSATTLAAIATAATTTTTPATVASAATPVTTAATTTTATLPRGAIFARTSLVDGEITAIHTGAVEGLNGSIGFFLGCHGDKGKPAGAAGHAVKHEVYFHDGAMLAEEVLDVVFADVVGEVPNKQFCIHLLNLEIAFP